MNKSVVCIFAWEDITIRTNDLYLTSLSMQYQIINIRCKDISKLNVDKVMNEVFGYSSLVDPQIFVGSCVKKSNLNGTHDGIIINCPIDNVDNNYIYQMVIANNIDDTLVIDLRVPIIKKKIPFVYKKYRPLNYRFSRMNVHVELVEASNVFSKDETQKILSFCDKLGLEYGEMDIIRDYKTQQIYIVDANNTPAGPPRTGLKKEDYNKALEILKKEIEFHLLNSAV